MKDTIGMGYGWRQRHELLMLATVGSPATPLEAERPDSVLTAPRRGHSQKPDEAVTMIEAMFPGVPKIELFAWCAPGELDKWGNEELEATA